MSKKKRMHARRSLCDLLNGVSLPFPMSARLLIILVASLPHCRSFRKVPATLFVTATDGGLSDASSAGCVASFAYRDRDAGEQCGALAFHLRCAISRLCAATSTSCNRGPPHHMCAAPAPPWTHGSTLLN